MKKTPRPLIAVVVLTAFLVNTFGPMAQAQDLRLPEPGVMVHLSPPLDPAMLKGIKIHTDNPFRFDFILDKGDSQLNSNQFNDESLKLIKYFLASLTIPEKDLWVNLSPYEKERIIPQSFGLTEMGRDLLAEDYMLKQVTASLIYPEGEVGKKFWKRIYEEAAKKFGTTNIPVNTFNKVWIVPQKAVVYENAKAGTAYVLEAKLKVMLDQDYLSLQKHVGQTVEASQSNAINALGSNIVREVVIPELTREVNEDKNFASLRQVYSSLILATWYKKKIKDSILSRVYEDKNKTTGINIDDPQEKERIYQRYLQAFKKGVYNYIKEDQDILTQEMIPRKYFSGGLDLAMDTTGAVGIGHEIETLDNPAEIPAAGDGEVEVDAAMNVTREIPIIDVIPHGEVTADSVARDFKGRPMQRMLDNLDLSLRRNLEVVSHVMNILLIGGSKSDVARVHARFPRASITVVNLDHPYLAGIQEQYKDSSYLHLFRADAQRLSEYHAPGGEPYFPAESFDLIAAPGVDESAFLPTESRDILQRIAAQELHLLRKGGVILHNYELLNKSSDPYQREALERGVVRNISVSDFDAVFWKVDHSAQAVEHLFSDGQAHQYIRVPEEEARLVYGRVIQQSEDGRKRYIRGFIKKAGALLFKNIDDPMVWEKSMSRSSSRESISHEGLFRDENGVYWILKGKEVDEQRQENYKNMKKRELLAYLLTRGWANFTPIRPVSPSEAKALGLTGPADDYYLTRVVVNGNMYGADIQPHQGISEAFSALLVAHIAVRKTSHLGNIAFINGHEPVSIDQDATNNTSLYPATEQGFKIFISDFLTDTIIKLVSTFVADRDSGKFFSALQMIQLLRDMASRNGVINLKPIESIMENQGFGLGRAYIENEQLDVDHISQSIQSFKSISNVRALAEEAGYKGQELEDMVRYIETNQRTSGRDMDLFWQTLTGKKAGFTDLDRAMVTVKLLNNGHEYQVVPFSGFDVPDLSENDSLRLDSLEYSLDENAASQRAGIVSSQSTTLTDIVAAMKNGEAIHLDISNFEGTDEDSYKEYIKKIRVFADNVSLAVKLIFIQNGWFENQNAKDKDSFQESLRYGLFELIFNAWMYGNKLDNRLPIFIKLNMEEKSVSVINFNSIDQHKLDNGKYSAAKKAGLSGEGQAVKLINEGPWWDYTAVQHKDDFGPYYYEAKLTVKSAEKIGGKKENQILVNPEDADFDSAMSTVKQRSETADKAVPEKNGGIDLTPANMNLQTQNMGGAIKFNLDPAQLAQLQNAPGFMPVIIRVRPMTDLRRFLGATDNSP